MSFIIVLILMFFSFQPHEVVGSSMDPTLSSGQMVYSHAVPCSTLKTADIVIFDSPIFTGQQFIKRVIAVPGQTIKITNGDVFVDGQRVYEEYLPQVLMFTVAGSFLTNGTSYTLAQNEFFVMGDNRPNSNDSRTFGPIICENVLQKLN